MIDIWVLLGVMMELSALILLGLVLTKLHLLDEKGSAVLSTLVVHVFNPNSIHFSLMAGDNLPLRQGDFSASATQSGL